ncbi:MAG: hypothetical protein GAK35_02843 [Herbaspirillum frisingense]|uniref:Uncharacterized protein n=1 Tax=Herbaspirillum frisingense TaxID=92645 RepID=A0A7V8FVD0_9BURK|nr:MAG: hypothetical protein GAK35_02843 [Herbaspirillum frisingense]
MSYRYLIALGALALSACATTAGYEKRLNTWVGANEIDLVRQWGPPAQSYESGDRKFLTYANQRNVFIPGSSPSYQTTFIGNTAYTQPVGGSSPMNVSMSCMTTFEVAAGRIVGWTYRGNDCKAKE